MATLGEVQVKITADLAPLHSAMAEAKRMTASLDKELNKSRKIVVQQFDLQKQINSLTGVDKTFKSATESASAFGSGIDKLRQKLLPLEAATKKYTETLQELERAKTIGAITDDEFIGQKNRAATALQNMTVLTQAQTNAQKLNNQQSLNMGMQLNDISVMLASGQNPFVMMMQQGMQIGQIFDQAGVGIKNAGPAMLTAITGFFTNPINIAVFAVAALAGTIPMIWEAVNGSPAKTAEEVLDSFRARLDEISKSSETAGNAIQGMFERLSSGTFDELLAGVKMTENELKSGIGQAIDDLQGKLTSFRFETGDNGLNFMFNETVNQIDEMLKKVKEGSLSAEEFSDNLSKIYLDPSTPNQIKDFIAEIRTGVLDVRQLDSAYQALRSSMATPVEFAYNQVLEELQVEIDNIDSNKAKKELNELKEKFEEGEISSNEFEAAVIRLSTVYFDGGGIVKGLLNVVKAAIQAKNAIDGFANTTTKNGRQSPIKSGEFDDRFQGLITEEVKNKALRDALGSTPKPKKGPKGRKPKDNSDKIADNKQYLADLQEEVRIMGLSYDERERAMEQFKLEKEIRSAIKQLGDTATPAQIAALQKLIPLQKELNEAAKEEKKAREEIFKMYEETGGALGSSLLEALKGTKSLKDAALEAALAFAKIVLQAQLLQTYNNLGFGKSPTGGSSFLKGLFGAIFGGGRATGGNVKAGMAYDVGERGREKFIPQTNGFIVPNNKLESMSNSVQKVQLQVSLSTDDSAIAGIADVQIKNAAPQIIQVSVQKADKNAKRSNAGYMAENQIRRF